MKLEDLLMERREDNQSTVELQQEVERLEEELEGEVQIKKVLQCAINNGPALACCESCSSLYPLLPLKVQILLGELSVVEEEIEWLERKMNELKLDVYQEKKKTRELHVAQLKGSHPQWQQRQLHKLPSRRPNQIEQHKDKGTSSTSNNEHRRIRRQRRASISLGSSTELHNLGKYDIEIEEGSGMARKPVDTESKPVDPNKLSVELVRCLIGIFMKLNQTTFKNEETTDLTKQSTLTCMNSKGLVSKATFSCTTPVFPSDQNGSHLDPYEILPESDLAMRDVGPYKSFIQITRRTVDASRISDCFPAMSKLRDLMKRISKVNINHFAHKHKLAFWINVYNASVMNAFLQHGLPSTQEKLRALINQAEMEVGGFVFKASTIEHIILRHPEEVNHDVTNEKEMLLRHACGLDYPEPNVVFALCRGSWSSPALRFYTADEVMNELERAKVEYLEASVGVTSRKKILVPKLMQWHMNDFADDMESLVEWIYSQLPYKSSLKRLILECLNGETQSSSHKLIEIQRYASEFRYLIPVYNSKVTSDKRPTDDRKTSTNDICCTFLPN